MNNNNLNNLANESNNSVYQNNNIDFESDLKTIGTIKTLSIISIILLFLFFPISFILNIISSIMILTTDWQGKTAKDGKILWGILTLIILGPIASLIFAITSKKDYI